MAHTIDKLESEGRVKELQIDRVLDHLGVDGDKTLCDIGAGTGLFTFAAARRTSGPVIALEVSDTMIDILGERQAEWGVPNVEVRKVEGPLPLADGQCDAALLVTVYHELEDPATMLGEIHRVLKPSGRLGIIEFHGVWTPMGPPAAHRITAMKLREQVQAGGFIQTEHFTLGDNFYCSIFEKHPSL